MTSSLDVDLSDLYMALEDSRGHLLAFQTGINKISITAKSTIHLEPCTDVVFSLHVVLRHGQTLSCVRDSVKIGINIEAVSLGMHFSVLLTTSNGLIISLITTQSNYNHANEESSESPWMCKKSGSCQRRM